MTPGAIWRTFENGRWSDKHALAIQGRNGAQTVADVDANVSMAEAVLGGLRIPTGTLIAVAIRDPAMMAVAMLAVSKCGLSFVPVDPKADDVYIRQHAAQLGCRFLFRDSSKQTHTAPEIVNLDAIRDVSRPIGGGPIEYVITTSGSTGRPKGVPIQENHLEALLRSPLGDTFLARFNSDLVLNTFRPNFDMWIWVHLVGWAQGRTVASLEGLDLALNASSLAGPTTALFGVPSLVRLWGRDPRRRRLLSEMRVTLVGLVGEAFHNSQFNALREIWPKATIANLYGPAEATMLASGYLAESDVTVPLTRDGIVSIGQFIPELRVTITSDSEAELTGPTVFEGYLGSANRTSDQQAGSLSNARAYLTGDLVTQDENGFYFYCGRTDDQVKIAGQRVNLAGVDSRLRSTGLVDDAVTFLDDRGRLTGYVTPRTVEPRDAIEAVRPISPRWEVPAWLTPVDVIPRGPTGKVRRGRSAAEPAD